MDFDRGPASHVRVTVVPGPRSPSVWDRIAGIRAGRVGAGAIAVVSVIAVIAALAGAVADLPPTGGTTFGGRLHVVR